ncbi:hypothetical protein PVK06_040463 [Gossypium arboreum]|uniref:Uncharacterized protein n=1 Tax=Gossypium arboreum TaxID=29729 RepID=A0ABR0N5K4_GOSAR|nr:hypothetical protein PVK06_040463 [Gossypium arboreum]
MVAPLHTARIGQPRPDPHHVLELEAEPELHSRNSSYNPDLEGNDYFLGSSGYRYHSEFDLFSPLPPQYSNYLGSYPPQNFAPSGPYPPSYSIPPGPYPPPHSTPPSSISSMAFELYDFLSMFRTPPYTDEENVGCRNRSQREIRAPQKYTLRTTPSNHQF